MVMIHGLFQAPCKRVWSSHSRLCFLRTEMEYFIQK